MSTRVRSYSKINLGLAIGPLRADGFHGLTTVYQTLALHDLVTVEARLLGAGASRISIGCDHAGVPLDSRNTVWRMVEGALAALGIAAEVHVQIEKRLPVQGGLGAGSANAVAALVGLEVELGISAAPSRPSPSHPSHKGVAWMGHSGSGGGLEIAPPTSQGRDVGHPGHPGCRRIPVCPQ